MWQHALCIRVCLSADSVCTIARCQCILSLSVRIILCGLSSLDLCVCTSSASLRACEQVHPLLARAGIGRTGCFIACSACCEQLQQEGQVDVLGTVCRLRLDRCGINADST